MRKGQQLKPIADRLKAHMRVDENGCWRWTGVHNQHGYGMIRINGKLVVVSRVAYETFVGPIPEGKEIAHHCDVRDCFCPEHLFPATHQENMQDMCQKGRLVSGKAWSISDETVMAIREDAKTLSMIKIAEKYHISHGAVFNIVHHITHPVDVWNPAERTHISALLDASDPAYPRVVPA